MTTAQEAPPRLDAPADEVVQAELAPDTGKTPDEKDPPPGPTTPVPPEQTLPGDSDPPEDTGPAQPGTAESVAKEYEEEAVGGKKYRLKAIGEVTPFYVAPPQGEIPAELPFSERDSYVPRLFSDAMYPWMASNICYNPLYFEDVALERYGHSYNHYAQPIVSTVKFGGQFLMLPYQMTIDPIHKAIYPLGYYQPGEWAPYKFYQIPFNAKAAGVQAGVVTGFFFLIP